MKIAFILFFSFILISLSVFSIINLGKFLDITQKPSPSDVIMVLGGGGKNRIKMAPSLYRKGYSKSHKIIICNSKKMSMKFSGISSENIVFIQHVHNTMEEILAVKDYLLSHQLKSVLVVSDAPHSRRIIFLANEMARFEASGLKITVVGSDAPWWDRDHYYKNKQSRNFAILESVKLPYNYLKYGIFVKYGILESSRKFLSPLVGDLKHSFVKFFS